MKRTLNILALLCLAAGFFMPAPEVQAMNNQALTPKQQSIIVISAFTANGNLEKLQTALNQGLNAGLTVNEIKEILVQLYAYAGFPRSLNGINTFMQVMDERKAKGIADVEGREPSPMPADWNRDEYGAQTRAKLSGMENIPAPSGYQLFTPVIDTFLKEHLFADIFARDNLDHQSRELATISTLAGIPGLGAQLRFHLNAAMNTGLSEAQMKDFIAVMGEHVGRAEADAANSVLTLVLAERAKQ